MSILKAVPTLNSARIWCATVMAALACGACSERTESTSGPWELVVATDEARFLLDTSRIDIQPTHVRVWLRVEFPRPLMLSDSSRYDVTTIQQDLRCDQQLARSVRMNAFLRGEDSTAYFEFPDTTWRPFREQQLDEVYSRGACLLLSKRN